MSKQSLELVRQTERTVAATGQRWCPYCNQHKPAEGFKRLLRGKSRTVWICPGCAANRIKGAA